MVTLPDDLLALLSTAEDDLAAAGVADVTHQGTVDNLVLATKAESDAGTASLVAHKVAVDAAQAAIVALKAHFGIP